MKSWAAYGFLALSVVVAYQGYQNSQSTPEMEAHVRDVVCEIDPTCMVKQRRPSVVRTDIIRRRYQWRTTHGPVTVSCRRSLLLFGAWRCEARRGKMGEL